jgi:hypothetical protein
VYKVLSMAAKPATATKAIATSARRTRTAPLPQRPPDAVVGVLGVMALSR